MCVCYFHSFARVFQPLARARRPHDQVASGTVRIRSKSLSRAPLPRLTPVLNQFDSFKKHAPTTRRTARVEDEGLRGVALEGEPQAPAGGGVAAARRDDEAVRSLSSNSDRAHKVLVSKHKVLVSKKKTRTRRATRP